MGGLLSYSGLTTKIRAMEGRFLDDRQYREITELPDVPSAVTYLKQKPSYRDIFADRDESTLHRGEIEEMLRLSIYRDFTKLYRFSNQEQRKFLRLYFRRYEVFIIKKCLNTIFDHREVSLNLSRFYDFFNQHSQLDIALLSSCSSVEEFVNNLKGTEYYTALKGLLGTESPTLFDYEMALDLYYFRLIWRYKDKILKKKDLEEITEAYGQKFDLLNLQWIYRCKAYYHMQSTDVYALLVPVHYKLKAPQIKALVEAESTQAFEAILADTYYAKRYEKFNAATLEAMYAHILKHVLSSESRKHPYSIATLYSYLYHKEHEVNRLVIALECVRYNVAPDEAMKYISKT